MPLIGFRRGRSSRPASRCSSTGTLQRGGRGRSAGVVSGRAGQVGRSSCPLIVGRRGHAACISLQNLDREDAFSDADVRLLTTLASSLSVALENARLFDETSASYRNERARRRAGDHQQRPAGPGRASSTCRRCTSSWATRSRRSSTRRSSTSASRRRDARPLTSRIRSRGASRVRDEPIADRSASRKHRARDRRAAARQRRRRARSASTAGQTAVVQGEPPKSVLFVPLIVGGELTGVDLAPELDREDAFSDADVRLLSTLASSLSVALENARLFDETKRLLTETDERAAELAIINSVQQGLAAAARHAGDVRARRRQDPGDLRRPGRRHRRSSTRETNRITLPVRGRARRPQSEVTDADRDGSSSSRPSASPASTTSASGTADEGGQPGRACGEPAEVVARGAAHRRRAGHRVLISSRTSTHGRLQRGRRTAADDARHSLSVALENARLFDETKRLLAETNERAAELAIINSVQQGLADELDMQAMYDLVGDKIQRDLRRPGRRHRHLRPGEGLIHFPYTFERGVRLPEEPMPLDRLHAGRSSRRAGRGARQRRSAGRAAEPASTGASCRASWRSRPCLCR